MPLGLANARRPAYVARMRALEIGVDTFGDRTLGPDGTLRSHAQVLRDVVEEGVLTDHVGLAFFAVGEHHRD